MKNLYTIYVKYLGKDLDNEEVSGRLIAANDKEVYAYIDDKYYCKDWPECSELTKTQIMKDKGDYEAEYMGEFYDTKIRWELTSKDISDEDIAILTKHKIL